MIEWGTTGNRVSGGGGRREAAWVPGAWRLVDGQGGRQVGTVRPAQPDKHGWAGLPAQRGGGQGGGWVGGAARFHALGF